MPWLKLLHLAAVIVWCGALLYLPAVILAAATRPRLPQPAPDEPPEVTASTTRLVFIGVATPAALLAIASGTALFVWHGPLADWLVAKLGLVGLLALGHAACGVMVLRDEQAGTRASPARQRTACVAIGASTLLWIAGIAGLVLGKPA